MSGNEHSPRMDAVVREFAPGDESVFRQLNEDWIREYFEWEPKDEEVLSEPREYILNRGGRIFMGVRGGETIACCALLAIAPGEFELGKMAVHPSCRGRGIGKLLLETVIREAREMGVRRIYLETSHKLPLAIRLYESVGFRRLAEEHVLASPYKRSDIAMELFL